LALHGAAAVKHKAEGSRTGPGLSDVGSLKLEGEMDRAGTVRKDNFVVERGVDSHGMWMVIRKRKWRNTHQRPSRLNRNHPIPYIDGSPGLGEDSGV